MKHPTFTAGDRVEFDGSGNRAIPRWYQGTVSAIRPNGLIEIIDDGWLATSAVHPRRVRHIDE